MYPILPTGRHDLFFDENTALKITNSLVRNCCARESSTMVFRNMSDDDYVANPKAAASHHKGDGLFAGRPGAP
jgi:hypothetical protein